MAKKINPAVSVIIPMYNAEKYIGECLDSILAQTFQDFEIIVVDDCSTDNGVAVVENYLERGQIKFIRSKINCGYAGTPRNVGIKSARGKYLLFVDSDDAITPTAIEEMYSVAKKFNADVVSCQKWYETPMNGDITDKDSLKINFIPNTKFVDEPTPVANDIYKRVESLHQKQFVWSVWAKIIRKNFILENNLKMLDIFGEDAVFTICLACANSKYFHAPNVNYIYRKNDKSLCRRNDSIGVLIHRYGTALTNGFNYCNDFLSRQKFFRQNPAVKISALEVIIKELSGYFSRLYQYVPQYHVENFKEIRAEFEACENLPELATFLFNRMNFFEFNLNQAQIQNQQLQMKLLQAADFLKEQQKIIRQFEAQN